MLGTDVGDHRRRTLSGIVSPAGISEVADVLKHAAADGRAIYPISTGKNWGMGSAMPGVDGCTVVYLGAMRQIRELDLQRGYAVVEPGVTQRQLAERLKDENWLINVTSSCADTSIVGNALERGDGMLRSRMDDILGVEMVLPDGSVVSTGGLDRKGQYHGCVAGPDLTGLAMQSNMGIVTAMAVLLIPRPECTRLYFARAPKAALGPVIESLAKLIGQRLPALGMLSIGDFVITPSLGSGADHPTGPDDSFTITGAFLGTSEEVDLTHKYLQISLSDALLHSEFIDADSVPECSPLYARAQRALGNPSCHAVHRTLRVSSCDVDRVGQPHGFLALMPLMIPRAKEASQAVSIVQDSVDRHPVAMAMMEWNLISRLTANGVIQIQFDRDERSAARAHLMRDTARRKLLQSGFVPYRSDIDHAPQELVERPPDGMAATAARIKLALDPQNIISPSRYVSASWKET